jgi:hypothetical protein
LLRTKSEFSQDLQASDQERSMSGREREDMIVEALAELCGSLLNLGDGVRVVVRVRDARAMKRRMGGSEKTER